MSSRAKLIILTRVISCESIRLSSTPGRSQKDAGSSFQLATSEPSVCRVTYGASLRCAWAGSVNCSACLASKPITDHLIAATMLFCRSLSWVCSNVCEGKPLRSTKVTISSFCLVVCIHAWTSVIEEVLAAGKDSPFRWSKFMRN